LGDYAVVELTPNTVTILKRLTPSLSAKNGSD
jgi:hypothetical protein